MKVKNLFLACLAAVAMTACSNENDNIVDNGQGIKKDAKMQVSIELPKSTAVRGLDDAEGTDQENAVKNLLVVVSNTNGSVTKYFTTNQDNSTAFTTESFEVPSGANSTITVYANYGSETVPTADETIIGASDQTNGFHMNGIATNVVITAGSTGNTATVQINRVAAKIVERTENATKVNMTTNGRQMTFMVEEFALLNLSNKAGVWAAAEELESSNFNQYCSGNNKEFTYNFGNYTSAALSNNNVAYCLDNATATHTQVAYKVKATFEELGNDATFYVRKAGNDHTAYTLEQLKEAFPYYGELTNETSIEDCLTLGLYKYENGYCYYKHDITTGSEAKIVRNNLYKLNVNSITKLGTPELDSPEPNDPTALSVTVTVVEWTVNNNDIDFE